MSFPILSTLIFLPLISSFFILLSKDRTSNNSSIYISLFSSFATFLLSLFLWYSLDLNTSEFQFVEEKSWINNFIKFKLGVDGISILFIVFVYTLFPTEHLPERYLRHQEATSAGFLLEVFVSTGRGEAVL